MIHQNGLTLLSRIHLETCAGNIAWRQDDDGWYSAEIGARYPASFRFLVFEATNQVGVLPSAIELFMPGLSTVYFAGTEGFDLFLEILAAAFERWRPAPDPSKALQHLERGLSMPDWRDSSSPPDDRNSLPS
jgi:hypothetical protein